MSKKRRLCPQCKNDKTIKYGLARGIQTYFCQTCKYRFSSQRRDKRKLIKKLWFDYVFRKQTIRELTETYSLDRRIIRDSLDQYNSPIKQHCPRPIHLLVDATYFGLKKEGEYWCVLAARDAKRKENIYWLFAKTETTFAYAVLREKIEAKGYAILSITGDGFSGLKSAFYGFPYQMCQVHMERLVAIGTTRNPQTEAGQVLLALIKTLHTANSHVFLTRLNKYVEKYNAFLNEKSYNEITGRKEWTHRELRSAVLSLMRLKKYLFTFEHNKNIPKTTNSLEGYFSHLKDVFKIHRGANRQHAQKIIHSILLASSIAPNEKTKKRII